tara:strand:+ start:1282 stop:1812 length:531 start_codon:yes stop_codon:yes gene_type:complete
LGVKNILLIIDDFLNHKDFEKVFMKYSVGGDQSIWGIQRGGNNHRGSEFLFSHIKDDPFFTDYLFSKVVDKLDKGSYELERVYFNGQWSGRESDLHKDGCDITALLYMHNRYEYGWGGFTEIITKPNPILIHPIPNRLLIFPGMNSHKAYSFAYQTCPLRVTLAFKIHSIDTVNKL